MGISSPTTTKLKGYIAKTKIIIMLDSEATHNFIAPKVIKKTKLKPQHNNNYEVLFGTGITVKGTRSCRGVKFRMSDLEFEAASLI